MAQLSCRDKIIYLSMIKREALIFIGKKNKDLKGTQYNGQKILGFIMAPIHADYGVVNIIAKRYLATNDHSSYHGFVNNDYVVVDIYVILQSNDESRLIEDPFDTMFWNVV